MKHTLLLSCVIVLLCISQVMLHLFPFYGLIITGVILALFLFFAVYDVYDLAAEEVFAYASVLPLLSLLSYALPWITGTAYQIVFSFFLLLLAELFYSFLPLKQKLYHNGSLIWLPLTILIGGAGGWILALYSPHGQISLIWGLFMILITSISEAIYFQGLIQNATTFMTDKVLGVLFTIFLFGLFYATPNTVHLSLILVYILIASTIYAKWKNIYLVISFFLSFQIFFFLLTQTLFLQ